MVLLHRRHNHNPGTAWRGMQPSDGRTNPIGALVVAIAISDVIYTRMSLGKNLDVCADRSFVVVL